jgi:hypothetical protein
MTWKHKSQLSSQVYFLPTSTYRGIQIQTLSLLRICEEMLHRSPKLCSKNRQAK